MAKLDEYIDQLLAEMQMPEPAQKVVRNILDEPIPETVKRRLLKPLFPKKYRLLRPPPTWKDRESKAILEQFDPPPLQTVVRTIRDYQREILEVFGEEQRAGEETWASLLPNALGNRKLPASLADGYL